MTALDNLDKDKQDVVRAQVKQLLDKTEAYQSLDPQARLSLANGLVNVVAFLSDPAAGQPELAKSVALESGAEKLQKRLAEKQNLVGQDFQGGAIKAGVDQFERMVSAVDFPKFVSGLIEGVFTSIVNSSIRQMEAYGKLLEAVVASVEQFANDNITTNQARDYLADRFPSKLSIDIEQGTPRLALTETGEDEGIDEVQEAFGLKEGINLDEEESEAKLVRLAQLEMAKLRQKQLATMVLLGINRIVVTDGLINAKVIFDMKASDEASRTNRASMYDTAQQVRSHGSGGGWFSGDYDRSVDTHKTVVSSATSDESESKAKVKANLTGEVRVNFKSETFPLEKMASVTQLDQVNQRAQP
ncbi:MAG: hypothetical protein JXA30_22755 [Deltaproteobacteria bacterium]|nr:hypothetical protein [Deltaproteobacteria bacterium]